MGISAALLMIMAILVGWGWTNDQNAHQLSTQMTQVALADFARATALANEQSARKQVEEKLLMEYARGYADKATSVDDPLIAEFYALESLKFSPSLQAYQLLGENFDLIGRHPDLEMDVKNVLWQSAFSPDGRFIAACGRTGISLWDIPNGREVLFLAHEDAIAFAFSPDGHWLVSGGNDGSALLWSLPDGHLVSQIQLAAEIHSVEFRPDGQSVALSSSNLTNKDQSSSALVLWDPFKGNTLQQLPSRLIIQAVFSPNGQYVASVSWSGQVSIWDLTGPQLIAQFDIDFSAKEYYPIAFSPDSRFLLVQSRGNLDSWDFQLKEKRQRLYSDSYAFATESRGNGLALARSTGIYFYDYFGNLSSIELMDNESANLLAFSPNLSQIAAVRNDGIDTPRVQIWNIGTGRKTFFSQYGATRGTNLQDLRFSPDGRWLATSNLSGLYLWDTAPLQEATRVITAHDSLSVLKFSPSGKYIQWERAKQQASVWDATSAKQVMILPVMNLTAQKDLRNDLTSVVFSSNDEMAALGFSTGDIRVFNLMTGELVFSGRTHGKVMALDIDKDRMLLLSAGDFDDVILWNLNNGSEVQRFDGTANDIEFSKKGDFLAIGEMGGQTQVWSTDTGQKLAKAVHPYTSKSINISPDGAQVVSVGWDSTIRVITLNSGRIDELESGRTLEKIIFSPNSNFFVVDGGEVWTRSHAGEAYVQTQNVGPGLVAFSPDSLQIITADGNKIHIWDVASQKEIMQIYTAIGIRALSVSSDGRFIFTFDGQTVRSWIWKPDEIFEKACQRLGRNLRRSEWGKYFPDESYHATCPQWPLEPEPTATPTP